MTVFVLVHTALRLREEVPYIRNHVILNHRRVCAPNTIEVQEGHFVLVHSLWLTPVG